MDVDGLLLKNGRIIVPVSLRPAMLALIHEGHLGAEKSKARARQALWWPGMAKMIDATVGACATYCAHSRPQSPETLMPHPVPSFPWQKIGADIFTYNRRDYLLIVDYFSKFPFILLLPDKTASSVVAMLKSVGLQLQQSKTAMARRIRHPLQLYTAYQLPCSRTICRLRHS